MGDTFRVVVVDDDPWRRAGMLNGLSRVSELEVIAALSHDEAEAWGSQWQVVNGVVVDAHDPDKPDRYPGVAVVQRVREWRSKAETRILVVSHLMTNDALRLRMKEAGADFYYEWHDVRDSALLAAAILNPDERHAPEPHDRRRLAQEGLSWYSSHPAKILSHGSRFASASGLSRRQRISIRQKIGREGGVRQPAFTPAAQDLSAPTWTFLGRLVEWLLGRGSGNADRERRFG